MFTNTPPPVDPYQQPQSVFGGKNHTLREKLKRLWPSSWMLRGAIVGGILLAVAIAIGVLMLLKLLGPAIPSPLSDGQNNTSRESSGQPSAPKSEDEKAPAEKKPEDKKTETKPNNTNNNTSTGGSPAPGSGGSTGGGSTGGGASGGSGGSGCPLPSYPNTSCTGVPAGTSLTVMNGDMTINAAGTVIENKDIRGCISVNAPGVIIRKSKVSCSGFTVISSHNNYSGTRLLVEDTEIHCNNTQGTAMGDYNFTARRVNIHSCENGFDMDTDITLEDSYVHDLISYNPTTDPHIDGIQSPIGSRLLINHNTIYATNSSGSVGNAAININNSSGGPTSSDTTISNNLLAGGGYTLYCPIPNTSNFQITNNRFSTAFHATVGYYGPSTDCEANEIASGNVYHESGMALIF